MTPLSVLLVRSANAFRIFQARVIDRERGELFLRSNRLFELVDQTETVGVAVRGQTAADKGVLRSRGQSAGPRRCWRGGRPRGRRGRPGGRGGRRSRRLGGGCGRRSRRRSRGCGRHRRGLASHRRGLRGSGADDGRTECSYRQANDQADQSPREPCPVPSPPPSLPWRGARRPWRDRRLWRLWRFGADFHCSAL